MNDATICVLMSGSYASAVLVTDYEDTTNTFVAFFDELTGYVGSEMLDDDWYYVYEVYKTGETEPTKVYSYYGLLGEYDEDDLGTGCYQFTVDNDSVVEEVNLVFPNDHFVPGYTSPYDSDYHWAFDEVAEFDGETLLSELGGEFRVDDAKYISLYWTVDLQDNYKLEVAEVDADDVELNAGDVVAVAYTGSQSNSKRDAAYVYIIGGELHVDGPYWIF